MQLARFRAAGEDQVGWLDGEEVVEVRLPWEGAVAASLEPGDLLATGTPSGVGFSRTPPEFLTPGDIVCAEIDRIGTLHNVVK